MAYVTSVGYKILQSRTQVFDNFEKDKQLDKVDGSGNKMRENFYEFLGSYKNIAGDFDNFCNVGFIYDNKLKGDKYPNTIKNNLLGHSQTKKKFASLLSNSDPTYAASTLESLLDNKLIYSTDKKEKELELEGFKSIYDQVLFGRNLTWSYVDNNYTTDFFENTILKDIPCILGLLEPDTPRYILSHNFSKTGELVKPTAFDAGIDNDLWRPGGKTYPLAACTGKGGKDEVVHEPNVFNEIVNFEHNQ